MKGLVCHESGAIELLDIPRPKLEEDTDAIVRVTLSTICTSDLHIMHGAVPRAVPEKVLGHEFVGEVAEVGRSVKKLKPGARVAANCITFCGECAYCRQGFINNCEKGGWELGCRIDIFHTWRTFHILTCLLHIGKDLLNLLLCQLFVINDTFICFADRCLDLFNVKGIFHSASFDNFHIFVLLSYLINNFHYSFNCKKLFARAVFQRLLPRFIIYNILCSCQYV